MKNKIHIDSWDYQMICVAKNCESDFDMLKSFREVLSRRNAINEKYITEALIASHLVSIWQMCKGEDRNETDDLIGLMFDTRLENQWKFQNKQGVAPSHFGCWINVFASKLRYMEVKKIPGWEEQDRD